MSTAPGKKDADGLVLDTEEERQRYRDSMPAPFVLPDGTLNIVENPESWMDDEKETDEDESGKLTSTMVTIAGTKESTVTEESQNIEDQLSRLLEERGFQDIDNRFRQFNIFEAVGSVRAELRHSNFLAYLLSPNRPHGLGHEVLQRVLCLLITKLPHERRPIGILKLMVGDLESAFVERERDNIDITIEISALQLVVAIENKVGSELTGGQLARYKKIIKQKYNGWGQLFVLLNADGLTPDTHYDDDYVTIGYGDLADLLSKYVKERENSLPKEMALVIENYVHALRRHVVIDQELTETARQLYSRYKEAFDFILECRPDPDDLLAPLRDIIKSSKDIVSDRPAPRRLRFVPSEWTQIKELNSCPIDMWTKTGRNLLFEVRTHRSSDKVDIRLVLGPGDVAFRKHIYSWATKNSNVFLSVGKPMGHKTTTIYTYDLLSAGAGENMEDDEKKQGLQTAWGKFCTEHLESLKNSIAKSLHSWKNSSASGSNTDIA